MLAQRFRPRRHLLTICSPRAFPKRGFKALIFLRGVMRGSARSRFFRKLCKNLTRDFPIRFAETTLKPCYGLAEATLAVTLTPLADSYKTAWINQQSLREKGLCRSRLAESDEAVAITRCGVPIDETEIHIAEEDGNECDGTQTGKNSRARRKSVMEGYLGNVKSPIDADGWLDTGDLGFRIGEEIYITGRAKDLIIRGGVNIHPQEIEKIADAVEDVRMGTATAFSCVVTLDKGREEIVLVVETRQKEETKRQKIVEEIRRAVVQTANVQLDHIELAAPGTVPKTTSGKIQRGLCRERFLNQLNAKMNNEEILKIIIEEIRQLAANGNAPPELAAKQFDAETKLADLTLDSLGKMSLLAAVEDRADIILGEGDLMN